MESTAVSDTPPDIVELLANMRSAIEILQEKYPAMARMAGSMPYPHRRFEWFTYETSRHDLESELQRIEMEGWEIFSILPATVNCIVIVARKEYPCRAKSSGGESSSPNSNEMLCE